MYTGDPGGKVGNGMIPIPRPQCMWTQSLEHKVGIWMTPYHSHGNGDGHEAECNEDDDVPVLSMVNKFVGQLLHWLRKRTEKVLF